MHDLFIITVAMQYVMITIKGAENPCFGAPANHETTMMKIQIKQACSGDVQQ